MTGLPIFPTPTTVAIRLLNRLLQHQPWALEHLRPHNGKSVALKIGKTQLYLYILDSGYVQNHAKQVDATPNVTLILPSENLNQLPNVLRTKDPSKISNLMQIQGDAGLAQVVSDLARDLRWDIEHSLSSRIGDIPALGIIKAFKLGTSVINNISVNLTANITEYLNEESQILANKQDLSQFQQQLKQLTHKIDQAETMLSSPLDNQFGKHNA